MKKFTTFLAAFTVAAAGAYAQEGYHTLDLTKATTELTFNEVNGAWTGTFDDDAESIDSQCFVFIHNSMADWGTWWGFTASNSTDNTRPDDTITYQYSNMAKGGIMLSEDGTVMLDEWGNPVCSAEVPYLVAYYSPFMTARPLDMTFADGKSYEAVSAYVNLQSYAYYSMEYGDSFARAFNRTGDKYTLTIHGVAPDDSEKTVVVELASCDNGNLTINRGWRYVDLSPLGEVNEIYFTMKSTDEGSWGDNTPEYFCLDKLIVKDVNPAAIESVGRDNNTINYDRASSTVTVEGIDFAAVYDSMGYMVMSSHDAQFSISSLAAGVYVVKAGNAKLKIAK